MSAAGEGKRRPSCGTVGCLLFVAAVVGLLAAAGRRSSSIDQANVARGEELVRLLEGYRAAHGQYPASLAALTTASQAAGGASWAPAPALPRTDAGQEFAYEVGPDGARCQLTFAATSPLPGPSDAFYAWTSETKAWALGFY